MKSMKWYQFFLFIILILWSPLRAIEEVPTSVEFTLVADQKSNPKDSPPPEKEEKPANSDEQKASDEPVDMDDHEEHDMKKATESYETAFIKTIVVLVGLLVLVILTVWMFKKISHGRLRSFNYMKSIKILEKRPLSPKSMLYLIEVGGKQVLIAESQLHVKNVASLDWLGSDKDL